MSRKLFIKKVTSQKAKVLITAAKKQEANLGFEPEPNLYIIVDRSNVNAKGKKLKTFPLIQVVMNFGKYGITKLFSTVCLERIVRAVMKIKIKSR